MGHVASGRVWWPRPIEGHSLCLQLALPMSGRPCSRHSPTLARRRASCLKTSPSSPMLVRIGNVFEDLAGVNLRASKVFPHLLQPSVPRPDEFPPTPPSGRSAPHTRFAQLAFPFHTAAVNRTKSGREKRCRLKLCFFLSSTDLLTRKPIKITGNKPLVYWYVQEAMYHCCARAFFQFRNAKRLPSYLSCRSLRF